MTDLQHQQRATVQYACVSFDVEGDSNVLKAIAAQTAPFFVWSDNETSGSSLLTLRLFRTELPEEFRLMTAGRSTPIIVDCSLYEHLASSGNRWDAESGYLIRIEKTNTYCWFSLKSKEVRLYQANLASHILDSVRLIKNLMTPAVELAGGIQIHASGVVVQDQGVLLLGDQKQGKTTLLLELLSKFKARQLSCDTTVLRVNRDGLAAYGSPSPFSTSHGTMADYRPLYPAFPAERKTTKYDTLWTEGKKSILDSAAVVEAFGTSIQPIATKLNALIFLNFNLEGPVGLTLLERPLDVAARLRHVYLGSYDEIYPNWHQYIICDDSTISKNIEECSRVLAQDVDLYELHWAPSAESLLKRVPVLGRGHRDLGDLLHF